MAHYINGILKRANYKTILEVVAIAIIAFVFLCFFENHVPYNMDEFCAYHALSCHYYPFNMLNVFRASAERCDLAISPNLILPLRSYTYIGSFPCLVYYPLFKLWPSPHSARLLGLIMLALQAFFIRKLFKVDLLISFILLLSYMPYSFTHIADLGPVSIRITMVFFVCYLAKRWGIALEDDAKRSWLYPFFIGVLLFIIFWTKGDSIFMLPAVCVLSLYYLIERRGSLRAHDRFEKAGWHVALLFVTAGILSLILLNSTDSKHHSYYEVLFKAGDTDLSSIKTLMKHMKEFLWYFLNPVRCAIRHLQVKDKVTWFGVSSVVAVVALFSFGIAQLYRKKIPATFAIMNIALSAITFFIVCASPRTWAMHHLILALPFIILALSYICSKLNDNKIILGLLLLLCAVNFSAYVNALPLKPMKEFPLANLALNDFLNENYAKKNIFVVIDWGMYYFKALYGDSEREQCVLYIAPLTAPEDVGRLKDILKRRKRRAMFIAMDPSNSNMAMLKNAFPGLHQLKTGFDTDRWRVWYGYSFKNPASAPFPITIGDEFRITGKEGSIVHIYPDESALEESRIVQRKSDRDGLSLIMDEGKLLMVGRGTKAQLIARRKGFVIAKILEGRYAGRECLVLIQNVEMPGSGKKNEAPATAKQKKKAEEKVSVVKIGPGQGVAIYLEAKPETGFKWQLTMPPDATLLEFISSKYEPPRAGVRGRERWAFKGKKPGTTKMQFMYLKPSEKGAELAHRTTFIVEISKEAPKPK